MEIFTNRLSTTMQIFMTMNCLILMSEKYVHFRKPQKHVLRNFFLSPYKSLDPCTSEIFFELCVSEKSVQKLEKNWNF